MHLFAHLLFGMTIGALLCMKVNQSAVWPLAVALTERAIRFGDAFRKIVFAQVRFGPEHDLHRNFLQLILPLVHLLGQDAHCPDVSNRLLPVIGNLIRIQ